MKRCYCMLLDEDVGLLDEIYFIFEFDVQDTKTTITDVYYECREVGWRYDPEDPPRKLLREVFGETFVHDIHRPRTKISVDQLAGRFFLINDKSKIMFLLCKDMVAVGVDETDSDGRQKNYHPDPIQARRLIQASSTVFSFEERRQMDAEEFIDAYRFMGKL